MVMAIELYQHESERRFCHFVTYAHQKLKLVSFVESRKQMTTESYKLFIEHAYNQFVTHEAFHTSAVSKTKAKDITGHGIHQVSTKLSGYVWIGSTTKIVHTKEDQADDVVMEDVEIEDEDETDKKARELPNLEVRIEEEEHEPQQVQDDQEEGAGSHQGEEASVEPGNFGQPERPEFPKAKNPQDRYCNFIMSQVSLQENPQLRQWVFDLTSNMTEQDRRDQNLPLTVEDVSTFAIALFSEVVATESHSSFMLNYQRFTQTDVDPDTFHAIQLSCRRIREENENISIMTFLEEDTDNPELPGDPENKKEIEHMTPESKHPFLETDNSALIDCTVQWMNMLNEDFQKRIVERVSFVKKEAEEEQDEKIKKRKSKRSQKYLQLRSACPRRLICQRRCLDLEALDNERHQLPMQALVKEREQGKKEVSMMMIPLLQ